MNKTLLVFFFFDPMGKYLIKFNYARFGENAKLRFKNSRESQKKSGYVEHAIFSQIRSNHVLLTSSSLSLIVTVGVFEFARQNKMVRRMTFSDLSEFPQSTTTDSVSRMQFWQYARSFFLALRKFFTSTRIMLKGKPGVCVWI